MVLICGTAWAALERCCVPRLKPLPCRWTLLVLRLGWAILILLFHLLEALELNIVLEAHLGVLVDDSAVSCRILYFVMSIVCENSRACRFALGR